MNNLKDFLDKKPLYYDEIDYNRFPAAFSLIKDNFKIPPCVHIVGTNGKGSTGRFLALLLKANGRKVAHFTSPHIFSFNERFWLDGRLVNDAELQKAHENLLKYFCGNEKIIESLSYFEWATLLACELFAGFDEVIFEAGMGGEYDATNVLEKKLSIFTPLGLDHMAFLGESLEQIATTKLNAMSKNAIISPFFAKMDLARQIAKNKGSSLQIAAKYSNLGASKIYLKNKSEFLKSNFALALSAINFLGFAWNKQILAKMSAFDLKGRCEKIAKNLYVDVGHNEHAAKAIIKALKEKKIKLIYNCFADKDAGAVLKAFVPKVEQILLYNYKSEERKLAGTSIAQIAKSLKIPFGNFNKDEFYKDKKSTYLVFGSFMLVSEFLKDFYGFKK